MNAFETANIAEYDYSYEIAENRAMRQEIMGTVCVNETDDPETDCCAGYRPHNCSCSYIPDRWDGYGDPNWGDPKESDRMV